LAYYAATALCIALAALASAFGPVMVVLAAACLLFVLRRENWLGNVLLTAGIGAWELGDRRAVSFAFADARNP
jgi:hypothetical protein